MPAENIKGPSTLATLFDHMWPRIVAGIFIPVGNHYFQALASTLQFVAQVCDRMWLVPATDRAFAYITYMSPPHVALVCSGPTQCAATCGWTKWPVCSGPNCCQLMTVEGTRIWMLVLHKLLWYLMHQKDYHRVNLFIAKYNYYEYSKMPLILAYIKSYFLFWIIIKKESGKYFLY